MKFFKISLKHHHFYKRINLDLHEKSDKEQMVKVVLISLYDPLSIGHRILHNMLNEKGCTVYSMFLKSGKSSSIKKKEVELLLSKLKEIKPDLVGISLRSKYFKVAARLTEDIKKEIDTKVIWGGVHPTMKPKDCLTFADAVCIGEGEDALIKLVGLIGEGKKINKISNLWIKEGKKIIKNDVANLEEDLDKIPFPDYSDSNKYYIEDNKCSTQNLFPDHQVVYSIITSRGCPFNCSFCNCGELRKIYGGKGKYIRRRSVKNVIEELRIAKKSWPSIEKIYFVDDVFSYDLEWLKEFTPLYKKYINLPFYCYVHPLCVTNESISLLRDAGLYEVNIGIQSGSERVRKQIYNRFETNEQIVNAIRILNKYKIRVVCDLILGSPYENEDDKKENLKLLIRLSKPIILLTYNLLFFPNKLTEMALKDGFIKEEDLEENKKLEHLRWHDKFSQKFSDEDLFWNSLYSLAAKGYSKKFINKCYSNEKIRKNPSLLAGLVKWIERRDLLVASIPKILGYIKRNQFKLLLTKINSRWV